MSKGMTLDELVGYSSRDRQAKKPTRKRGTIAGWPATRRDGSGRAEILVWLHTKSEFYTLYHHKWPRVGRANNNPEQKEVYWGKFRCFESEQILEKQRFYDRDTGKREYPPVVCPLCRLGMHVKELVENGDLDLTEELFVYEVEGKKVAVNAGAIYGGLTGKAVTDDVAKKIKAAGIKRPWDQAVVARRKYVFQFVDNANPDEGPQVVVEPDSLGKALISEISNQRRTAGVQGDPLVNPYPFMLVFDSNQPPALMYNASAAPLVKLNDQVKRQIVDVPTSEIGHLYEPWNVRTLWASMEQACTRNEIIDWEMVFGPATKQCDDNGVYRGEKGLPGQTTGTNGRAAMTDLGKVTAPSGAKPEDFCENCKAYIGPDALECQQCGTRYEDDSDIPF